MFKKLLSTTAKRDEVVQQQRVEGPGSTPRTLHSLIDGFGRGIDPVGIVASDTGILDIVPRLELLEPFGASIVHILGVGNELGRRGRSVGGRHFKWRMGRWFKRQQLMLLLSAHDRHALLWSSLLLPQDSSVC